MEAGTTPAPESLDFLALARSAAHLEAEYTFAQGDIVFQLRIRSQSRDAVTKAQRAAVKQVRRHGQVVEEVNDTKLRDWLVRDCLVGWTGLTFRDALRLMRQDPASVNGQQALLDQPLPCTPEHARYLLEHAYELEGFVSERVMGLADEDANRVAQEKKV